MDKASLVPPKAFEYALKLKEGGLDIDLEKLKIQNLWLKR